jgi:hypothetical protein
VRSRSCEPCYQYLLVSETVWRSWCPFKAASSAQQEQGSVVSMCRHCLSDWGGGGAGVWQPSPFQGGMHDGPQMAGTMPRGGTMPGDEYGSDDDGLSPNPSNKSDSDADSGSAKSDAEPPMPSYGTKMAGMEQRPTGGGGGDEGDEDGKSVEGSGDITVGGYNPADFEHLQVSDEIRELFQYIGRHVPSPLSLRPCRSMMHDAVNDTHRAGFPADTTHILALARSGPRRRGLLSVSGKRKTLPLPHQHSSSLRSNTGISRRAISWTAS